MLCVTAAIAISFLMSAPLSHAQLDLHAHLDLKPGVGTLLRGNFSMPPLALSWDTKYATKASSTSLTEFDSPPLIVVSLYGHPYLSVTEGDGLWGRLIHFDRKDNVRRAVEQEYANLLQFIQANPKFAVAKTPLEAENLIADNRTPIILSIEGAYGVLETEADLKKWIDRGVAIVTPFHLNTDQYGGTAMMSSLYAFLMAPHEFVRAMMLTGGSCVSTYCKSPVGMSNQGRELVERLLRHRVWVDLAHANDLTIGEILPIFAEKKLPILVTHTSPRDIYPAERGLSVEVMNAIIEHDGLIGLIPTEDMIHEPWTPKSCFSSLTEYRQTVKEMIRRLGPERVVLASDINAPLTGLSPACQLEPGQAAHELEERGFYTYSQWNQLAQYVSPDPRWHEQTLAHFLTLWKRVRGQP